MEEKVVCGKEKKYVLYTVVGEERGRAGAGVWVVRVLLGTLLLVALAVVPYLSLRLAQVNDRTLVVFQQVPLRNRSIHQQSKGHIIEHGKSGHIDAISVLQSAALTRENYTSESNVTLKSAAASNSSGSSGGSSNSSSNSITNTNTTSSSSNSNNSSNSSSGAGGIVTLHESAVTLAVMEDTNNTRKKDNNTEGDDNEHEEDNSEKSGGLEDEKKEAEENATTEDSAGTSESPASIAQVAVMAVDASPSTPPAGMENTTGSANTTVPTHRDSSATSAAPAVSTPAAAVANAAAASVSSSAAPVSQTSSHVTGNESTAKASNVSSSSSTMVPNTTAIPTTSTSTVTHHPLAHKLVYVATTASGNHVGGFCVWKTDKVITRWSYFYENIPIEYQSHSDSSDHEMRGMLAAVRTWAPLWNDHHVVLRSHHPSIKGSDHPTRRALTRELEKLSEGRFSYELEWRLKKTDRVVDIAYCLSRLHRDYAQWYRTFESRVDDLLGQQDWTVARKNRVGVSQGAFLTDDPEDEGVIIPGKKK